MDHRNCWRERWTGPRITFIWQRGMCHSQYYCCSTLPNYCTAEHSLTSNTLHSLPITSLILLPLLQRTLEPLILPTPLVAGFLVHVLVTGFLCVLSLWVFYAQDRLGTIISSASGQYICLGFGWACSIPRGHLVVALNRQNVTWNKIATNLPGYFLSY